MNSLSRKRILSLISPLLVALGLHKILGGKYAGIGTILMFHRVLAKTPQIRVHNHESLEIDPVQFEDTIRFFKNHNYDFISLDDMPAYFNGKLNKFVAFTFDDGYKDNLDIAYPILKKHQIPFTIYVTTNFVNRKAVIWWYLLEEIIKNNKTIDIHWKEKNYSYQCLTHCQKEATFVQLRNLIMHHLDPRAPYVEFVELFRGYLNDLLQYTDENILSWTQLLQLSQDPLVTIGAHTKNHLPLKLLAKQSLSSEINDSRVELIKQLGCEVKHFAYPYGKYSEAAEREYDFVKNQGFKSAVTTNIGNVLRDHAHQLQRLPRINVNIFTTPSVLQMHISGFTSLIKKTFRI